MKTFNATDWLSEKIQESCDIEELQGIAEDLMSLVTEDDILSAFEDQIADDDLGCLQAYNAVAVHLPFSKKMYLILFRREFTTPNFMPSPNSRDNEVMDAAFAPEFQRMESDMIIYESTTDVPKQPRRYPIRVREIHNTGLGSENVVRILDAVRKVNLRGPNATTTAA